MATRRDCRATGRWLVVGGATGGWLVVGGATGGWLVQWAPIYPTSIYPKV